MDTAVFEDLWREQKLCDAFLIVAGVQFPVHKLILCSCSTYFKDLFTLWSSPDCRDYEIPCVSADIMKIILDYCYTGELRNTNENFMELFIAADFFNVSGITQVCCQVLEEQLSSSNCIAIWEITNKYYYAQLRNVAFFYILKHFEEVVTMSEDFLQLSEKDLCSIIDEDRLNAREETTVLKVVIRWVAHDPEERHQHLENLLRKVRLGLIHPNYLTRYMDRYNLLQYNRNCKLVVERTIRVIKEVRRGIGSPHSALLFNPRLPSSVLMAIGGWSSNMPTNSIEVYDNRSNYWVEMANGGWTPRGYHGTVFLNGFVYVIGGLDNNLSYNTVYRYDLVNYMWQEVAPMHLPRGYVSVALLNGLIYAMGGHNGVERMESVERYSPEANQWTMISAMNVRRSDASATMFNRNIYICGGFNGVHCLSSAETYNPQTDEWTMIEDMANLRSGVSVIAYANEIYALGGSSGQSRLNTVEAYNPRTNMWRPVPNMHIGRSNFSVGVVDDRLYVVGGFHDTSISSVECFDAQTEVWTQVRNMYIARSALSCCVVSDLPNIVNYVPLRPYPLHEDVSEE